MGVHHDSGRPMPDEVYADTTLRYLKFSTSTRQISIRNTGVNTLWISFNKENWHDVACGTSWDDRVNAPGFWYCTQTGRASFVVIGLQLNLTADDLPTPCNDELKRLTADGEDT